MAAVGMVAGAGVEVVASGIEGEEQGVSSAQRVEEAHL